MPYAILLLVAGAAPPPPDVVRLEDAKRFTNITLAEAKRRGRLARWWIHYVHEKDLEKDIGRPKFYTPIIYASLVRLHDPRNTPADRMSALRGLRKELGKDLYRKGE